MLTTEQMYAELAEMTTREATLIERLQFAFPTTVLVEHAPNCVAVLGCELSSGEGQQWIVHEETIGGKLTEVMHGATCSQLTYDSLYDYLSYDEQNDYGDRA